MPSSALPHPSAPLLRQYVLAVGAGHEIQVQEFGAEHGIAALLLHGGPGSGSSPLQRCFFDPTRWRLICPDQRGAGGSRPRGATANNRTDDLLQDLHALRRHLGLPRWLVVGGSWGATLALAHAAAEPSAVAALLLRASFLARREDIDWFFQGAAAVLPQAWSDLATIAPPAQRHALLPWLAQQLNVGDGARAAHAALAWWRWEQALAGGSNMAAAPAGDALPALIDRYRVQAHYLLHDCWLDAPTLLERCEAVPRVPTLLLHSRDDRVCRPAGALALQARLPQARLQWVDGAGHDPGHPAMAAAMTAALAAYAADGDFGGPR